MTRALRIKLDPIPTQVEGTAGLIEGVRIGLTSLGKGSSAAKIDGPVPAKITFRLRARRAIREATEEPEPELLGTLNGEIALRGAEVMPVFVVAEAPAETALKLAFDAEALAAAPAPTETGPATASRARRPRPRVLPLSFDRRSFEGTAALATQRLVIPAALVEGFRFFELEAELELGSKAEAEFLVNDVLDGRITATSPPPLPTFDILLMDDVGAPLDGVALRITHSGKDDLVTTDSTGFARLVADERDEGTVTVDDLAALKARLKPEWDEAPRAAALLVPPVDDETTVFALRGDQSPTASVDTEAPRTLRVQPFVFLARLSGMFFDLDKSFLLPTAMGGLKDARALYEAQSPAKLLLVGHTDTSGTPAVNDPLSLERARSVAAYLSDDVPTWEQQYASNVAASRRWGNPEDELMASALPDFESSRAPGENSIAWFQRTRGFPNAASLASDGRKQLITEYMDLDGANVKELGLDIELVRHGCGENFPLDETGEALDDAPSDEERAQIDRRVELFFFDKELGVQPKVEDDSNSKAGSAAYREWRRRAVELREISAVGSLHDRHISVLLLSNSGNVPLAERAVRLVVDGQAPVEATTDAEGVFESGRLPAGDHVLTVDGVETFVSATPTSIVKRPHVVIGHVLIPKDA